MTLKELSQLYWLNKEIEAAQKRLAELRARTGGPASPALTGMPHSKGFNGSKVEREVLEIISLEQLIENNIKRYQIELIRLQLFIDEIPESLTRQVYTYRFVNGLDWQQVAAHIGGGNTADSVKKICYRYLKKINQEGSDK